MPAPPPASPAPRGHVTMALALASFGTFEAYAAGVGASVVQFRAPRAPRVRLSLDGPHRRVITERRGTKIMAKPKLYVLDYKGEHSTGNTRRLMVWAENEDEARRRADWCSSEADSRGAHAGKWLDPVRSTCAVAAPPSARDIRPSYVACIMTDVR